MQSSVPLTAAMPLPASAPSSGPLLSNYLLHASSAPTAALLSLGPASSLVSSTSSASGGTPGSSPSVSSSSSSVVSAVTTSASTTSSSTASPASTARSRSAHTSTVPRRRLSSRYELCVHARLNCSCSCRSEVTKSHRWQHAYRARHTGCDCRWRELRESGRRKKRKASRDGSDDTTTHGDGEETDEAGETVADSAAISARSKEAAAQAEEVQADDEDPVEEIAPFDERVRLFANPPRSPPAMSASYLAPSYAPLSLDTVRAHVLPNDTNPPHQMYQPTYSPPASQQLPLSLTSSPPTMGDVQTNPTFATPASLSLMLPPAAVSSGARAAPGTATGGFMHPTHNTFPPFAASPAIQMQHAASLSASASHYATHPLGLALQSSSNYPANFMQLSPMQLTAANGSPVNVVDNMQLVHMHAAMQQQQQHQQLLQANGVFSHHSPSYFLPQTLVHQPIVLTPALHPLSSPHHMLSLPATAQQQALTLQQPMQLFTANPIQPAASPQPYSSALASPYLHPSLSSPTTQYLSFAASGPSASQLLSLPQRHSMAGMPSTPQTSPAL